MLVCGDRDWYAQVSNSSSTMIVEPEGWAKSLLSNSHVIDLVILCKKLPELVLVSTLLAVGIAKNIKVKISSYFIQFPFDET